MKKLHSLISLLFISGLTLSATTSGETLPRLIEDTQSYTGKLGYIDYGNGKTVYIPVTVTLSQSADNKHVIVDKVYTDPGYKVYSLSVLSIDLVNNQVIETSFDDAEHPTKNFSIDQYDFSDNANWSLTRSTIKQDNEQDARIVITESVKDGHFSSQTRVDYLATTLNEDLKRNWINATLNTSKRASL